MAYKNAIRNKKHLDAVVLFNEDVSGNLDKIQKMLINKTYIPSEYHHFNVPECGKIRDVAATSFYPDRIIHWAVMQATTPFMAQKMIDTSYASMPGRGLHKATHKIRQWLKDPDAKYFLKVDVSKFFESVNLDCLHNVLT